MTDKKHQAFGIDIGGSGIKGAVVDLETGDLVTDRERVPTPQPSTPKAVAEIVAQIMRDQNWSGPAGATFPAIIKNGTARSAANVDPSWVGVDVDKTFTEASGTPVAVLNDADAAGLAEVRFGAAKGVSGVVLVLTFGTGIGSGLFIDGRLVPNTELGHVELDGHDAERRASSAVRDRHELSWEKWAERVQHYMAHIEALFSPDLFVVGGGVSKKADKWVPHLDLQAPVRPAELLNNAGIVGAALAVDERLGE
ncbi:MAG TPA: ROK family protein [Mycobacteriales bacterium]|jgi:polyphosphate glucokinase|nr:ROK family protein [Mycobacteriales bacterium]